jgi:hypothetical protein
VLAAENNGVELMANHNKSANVLNEPLKLHNSSRVEEAVDDGNRSINAFSEPRRDPKDDAWIVRLPSPLKIKRATNDGSNRSVTAVRGPLKVNDSTITFTDAFQFLDTVSALGGQIQVVADQAMADLNWSANVLNEPLKLRNSRRVKEAKEDGTRIADAFSDPLKINNATEDGGNRSVTALKVNDSAIILTDPLTTPLKLLDDTVSAFGGQIKVVADQAMADLNYRSVNGFSEPRKVKEAKDDGTRIANVLSDSSEINNATDDGGNRNVTALNVNESAISFKPLKLLDDTVSAVGGQIKVVADQAKLRSKIDAISGQTKEAMNAVTTQGKEYLDVTNQYLGGSFTNLTATIGDIFTSVALADILNGTGADYTALFGDITQEQIERVGAFAWILVLSFNLAGSAVRGVTLAFAWAASCRKFGCSPLAIGGSWSAFVSSHTSMCLLLQPLLLPMKFWIAANIWPQFAQFVSSLQNALGWRFCRSATTTRTLAIAAAFVVGNGLAAVVFAALGISAASMLTHVPVM